MNSVDTISEKIEALIGGQTPIHSIGGQTPNRPLIIALDGRCASGKSTLAEKMSQRYNCNVFHMDDFFLPPDKRSKGRLDIPGENVDHERFLEEILIPLSLGRDVSYRKYDCHEQQYKDEVKVLSKPVNIVEGVYSMHPDLIGYYDFKVFCDVSVAVQKERIEKRNPQMAEKFFTTWIPLEEKYFEFFDIRSKSDIAIKVE